MNNLIDDPLDQIFSQARDSEPDLASGQFVNSLRAELELVQQPITKSKFDWLLVVAALLASCTVFFLTPLYSWLLALPAYVLSADTLQLFVLVVTLMVISFFVFFDWEFE